MWNQIMTGLTGDEDEATVAAMAQQYEEKLDGELRASGFNDKLSTGLELYYFNSGATTEGGAFLNETLEEEDEDDDDEGDSDIDNEQESEREPFDDKKDETGGKEQQVTSTENSVVVNDDDDLDNQSLATTKSRATSASVVMFEGMPIAMDREQMIQQAKDKVRKQMDEQKRQSKKSAAFQTRNNNKNYIKGKRIFKESF
jgi:hypothetical protein|mmetsp:Transcript_6106/g.7896  ORF Transcript_6106/g.7896 Transcript_6106/m.7896 type:complete len:200 (+) Transcript_6106:537-1136(+)